MEDGSVVIRIVYASEAKLHGWAVIIGGSSKGFYSSPSLLLPRRFPKLVNYPHSHPHPHPPVSAFDPAAVLHVAVPGGLEMLQYVCITRRLASLRSAHTLLARPLYLFESGTAPPPD